VKKNLRKIAKMVLIIGDAYLQYADKGIGQSGSTTVNAKRVNLNVIGKFGVKDGVNYTSVYRKVNTFLQKKYKKVFFYNKKQK
jgi:septin family protein